jgi:hypothetical protein
VVVTTVEIPVAEARVGDLFTGTVRVGHTVFTISGPLGRGTNGRLYVSPSFPYIDAEGRWENVAVVREVPEFAKGTVIRNGIGVRVKTNQGWVWINVYDNTASSLNPANHNETAIREVVEEGQETVLYDPNQIGGNA